METRVVRVPVSGFAIRLVDLPKNKLGENMVNAGFFGTYHEEGEEFTLPSGHLTCDWATEGKWTRHYGEERGRFEGDKFRFDCSTWSYQNQFQGKPQSTLVIRGGKASVVESVQLPEGEYAISGVPVIRGGMACAWSQATAQGWGTSSIRPTWHTLVGLKEEQDAVYVIGLESTTSNLVKSGEAAEELLGMGFRDVIKLDGGGSFYFNADGKTTSTGGSRRINTVITINEGTESDMFKIALGAGHGAKAAGKRCMKALDANETPEWVLNDRICDRIEVLLKSYTGYELLRLDDSDDGKDDIALAERVTAANQWGADFYLSIHHNAGINGGTGGGIVALSHPRSGKEAVEWRDELYEELIEHTGLKGNRATPKATSDLYVLRNTKAPAVLLELGFMDSKTDVPVILTEEYADACARAIVDVIVRRGGLKAKDGPDSWAVSAWARATNAGVLDGTRPKDTLTRQELAVVLAKLGLL
jgi:N-acetylmuramoyl-L-alanine amidase